MLKTSHRSTGVQAGDSLPKLLSVKQPVVAEPVLSSSVQQPSDAESTTPGLRSSNRRSVSSANTLVGPSAQQDCNTVSVLGVSSPSEYITHNPEVGLNSHDATIHGQTQSQLVLTETLASNTTEPLGARAGILHNAHHFVLNNSTLVSGERDIVASMMKSLSKRIIQGAEFDSAVRDPPPLCHPGTRVELNEKINKWFHDTNRENPLLWLYGPAGVGKSAVMQTFAESLAASKRLGAALFFSRPNHRKDPQRIIISIAYQLAVKIPSYRAHVAEHFASDPGLLQKGMKEHFRIFIVEPFVQREIRQGGDAWGILLDGLDECEGQGPQCELIRFISKFVLEFPHVPLVWVISSRPEPHITMTFADTSVTESHWREHIPINSPQACQDVEHYLNASFETIRGQFPHVPSAWPAETQFSKLAAAASGLFVFATTAVRFVGDINHADPVSRLNVLLSIMDRLGIAFVGDHPFAPLDALYTYIFESIPPTSWDAAKRVLGLALCRRGITLSTSFTFRLQSDSLLAASKILNLEQNVIYGSVHKLYSVLKVPPPKDAHKSGVSFLHASFADYLMDPTRSKGFFIDLNQSVDDIIQGLFTIATTEPQYNADICGVPGWLDEEEERSLEKDPFKRKLSIDAQYASSCVLTGSIKTARGGGPFLTKQDRTECLDFFGRVNTARLYNVMRNHVSVKDVYTWLLKLWEDFPEELKQRGLVKEVRFKDITFDHLYRERNRPTRVRFSSLGVDFFTPSSPVHLGPFIAKLKSYQRRSPESHVLILGGTPAKRSVFFCVSVGSKPRYYCVPYPF